MGKKMNTEDFAEVWSFGTIDLDEEQEKTKKKRKKARNVIGNEDAPVLDDATRRRRIERELATRNRNGRQSTMLSEGNKLG